MYRATLTFFFICAFFGGKPATSQAQVATDFDEVFFEYRYMQLVSTNIVGIYKEDQFFLPVTELFEPLLIFHEVDWERRRITGYINTNANSFVLDFANYTWRYRNQNGQLTASDFIIGEFDFYLTPEKFDRIFNFEFRVDLALLSVRLFTQERVPIMVRLERQRLRARMQAQTGTREIYHPQIGRQPKLFNGAFLDYNLNANVRNFENQSVSGTFTGGAELLHGDIQGSMSIRQSDGAFDNVIWNNVRWRYYRPQGAVRQVYVGDVAPRGNLVRQRMRGVSVTNQPLYPQRVIDEFNLIEQAAPDSEVEIFINDRLFDFFTVDETGQYNIRLPITYGINDIRVMVYSPDGRVSEMNRRLNIPFFFAPPGRLYYTATAGRTVTSNLQPEGYNVGVFSASYGLNINHTVRVRAEYQEGPFEESLFVAEHSGRWFRDIITNVQYAPTKYEQYNVTYQSMSNNFLNAYFNNNRGTYQIVNNGLDYQYGFSGFLNLPNRWVPMFLRAGVDNSEFADVSLRSYTANITTRYRTLSLSGGFRSLQRETAAQSVIQNRYTLTASYSTPRTEIWEPLRGIFLRSLIEWRQGFDTMERVEVSASRRIFNTGQLQVAFTHFVPNRQNALFFSLSFDIPYARFNTSVRSSGSSHTVNQSVRGSIGYFPQENIFIFDNRQQVGRAAVVANMFIDNDGSGTFTEGDEVLGNNAIRVVGAGARGFYKNDRAIFTQLRQYDVYNVEVNEALVRDPTLVALTDKFSIVTDPNQFKVIEVPFVRTGIIDGTVEQVRRGEQRGLSGLIMRLENLETGQIDAIRTFHDGSFYKMEVRPGTYRLRPDSTQLALLRSVAEPAYRDIDIVATEFGDYVEGLDFLIRPIVPEVVPEPEPVVEPDALYYSIQTALLSTLPRAMLAREEAERATSHAFEIQYSVKTGQYRLFSRAIEGLEQAEAVLAMLHQRTQFKDAFIITEETYDYEDIYFAVQIGAFQTNRRAEMHANEARTRYSLQVEVVYDEQAGWFKIQTQEWSDWSRAMQIRDSIIARTPYNDSFVTTRPPANLEDYTFDVQVGCYAQESFARRIAAQLTRETAFTLEVVHNPTIDMYNVSVRGVNDWSEALRIRNKLLEHAIIDDVIIVSRTR